MQRRGCAWAGSLARCGRAGRASSRQSRSERYSTGTSGGAAPTRRVLVLCHTSRPGRFRVVFVPTSPWLSTRTPNKNQTWSSGWTRILTLYYSHCSTQCSSRTQSARYRCLCVCDSFQSHSLTRRRPVPSRHLCLTHGKIRLILRLDQLLLVSLYRYHILGRTLRPPACSRHMQRDSRTSSRRCTTSTQNSDLTT